MDEVEGLGSPHRVVGDLRARSRVPGCDAAGFAQAAEAADAGCPFSALIKASATVTVDARLKEETMATERTAEVTWNGSLLGGQGDDRRASGARRSARST